MHGTLRAYQQLQPLKLSGKQGAIVNTMRRQCQTLAPMLLPCMERTPREGHRREFLRCEGPGVGIDSSTSCFSRRLFNVTNLLPPLENSFENIKKYWSRGVATYACNLDQPGTG